MYKRETGLLKISEIAEKAKVLPSTIRHYTDLGLLQFAATTEGGHRLYHEQRPWRSWPAFADWRPAARRCRRLRPSSAARGKSGCWWWTTSRRSASSIVDLLKDRGPFEGRVAKDGFTAGRMLAEYVPDMVILDLMLPGIDGFQVCRQIRQDQDLAGTKILAVTGYDTPENLRRIMDAGADNVSRCPLE